MEKKIFNKHKSGIIKMAKHLDNPLIMSIFAEQTTGIMNNNQ